VCGRRGEFFARVAGNGKGSGVGTNGFASLGKGNDDQMDMETLKWEHSPGMLRVLLTISQQPTTTTTTTTRTKSRSPQLHPKNNNIVFTNLLLWNSSCCCCY